MKCYLVGGAVRDGLLGLEVKEKDWVIVGANPQELIKLGYKQVGKDFPVFLHPETQEEYALARTERKSGKGYYGFEVYASPDVTLEDDLLRRDLTINAIAQDENGNLIDPYGGRQDLQDKILRHVSPAFVEDPVRVLRLARFYARFSSLGFTVAEETLILLRAMVRSGELKHLVAERVWQEWQRSLTEAQPWKFIELLRQCGALAEVMPEIDKLYGVPNPPKPHPEIDSGIHTLQVLEKACELSEDGSERFAAVLHDLGKALTPMNQWPRHIGHEQKGLSVIRELCSRLKVPAHYRDLALLVCEHHLKIHHYDELRPETQVKLMEQVDAFRRPSRWESMLRACHADGLKPGKNTYPQAEKWRYLFSECAKINATVIIEQGFQGEAIKQELHARRVACAKLIKDMRESNEK